MRKALIIVSVFLIFSVTGCDDNNNADCTFEEFREILANSTCISEDFISTCKKISRQFVCTTDEPTIRLIDRSDCVAVDCQTLSCDTFVVEGTPFQSGLFTDMEYDQFFGAPVGIFEVDDLIVEADCILVQP